MTLLIIFCLLILYGFALVFMVEIVTDHLLGLKMTFKGLLFELLDEVL